MRKIVISGGIIHRQMAQEVEIFEPTQSHYSTCYLTLHKDPYAALVQQERHCVVGGKSIHTLCLHKQFTRIYNLNL